MTRILFQFSAPRDNKMTFSATSVFFIIVGIFLLNFTSGESPCGPNESPKEGIDCKSDCCPSDFDKPSPCPDPCASACKCNFMYRRDTNGTCIPARECPAIKCPENEKFDPCAVCSENCTNSSPDGRRCRFKGRIGITVICDPKCRCVDNYWRNANGECVIYEQCQQSTD